MKDECEFFLTFNVFTKLKNSKKFGNSCRLIHDHFQFFFECIIIILDLNRNEKEEEKEEDEHSCLTNRKFLFVQRERKEENLSLSL